MSKEQLNETVRSDEFLNSKLYTNTQKIQVIDLVDSSLSGSKHGRDGQSGKHIKGGPVPFDGSYNAHNNAKLMKTANSFFQRNDQET